MINAMLLHVATNLDSAEIGVATVPVLQRDWNRLGILTAVWLTI